MKKSITVAAGLLVTLGSSAARAQEDAAGPFALKNFSTSIYLTTQYLFRGISNSDGPAIQGSFDWGYNGFFLGLWASNTEFSDSNLEIDYYGGYKWSWQGLALTLQGIYYTYPGDNENFSDDFDLGNGAEADYGEVNLGASYTFAGTLAPSVGLNYWYSPDFFGEDGDAHAVQASFGLSLPAGVGAYANVGYQDVEGDKTTGAVGGFDYVWYGVGVNKTIKGFKLDLSYQGTDESNSLEAVYPDARLPSGNNFHDLIDGYVVFTLSRTF